jgi:hypothetical protein
LDAMEESKDIDDKEKVLKIPQMIKDENKTHVYWCRKRIGNLKIRKER